MEEEWKKVDRFRRLEVSNFGNVRTVWAHKTKNLKPMKMKTTVGSYLKVSVTDVETGIQRQIGIHNLVIETFTPKPETESNVKLEPNHIDGNKHNNRSDNLEWMTRSENLKHAYATGLKIGKNSEGKIPHIDKSKPVTVVNVTTNEETNYTSAKEAANATGISPRTVQYNAFKRKNVTPVKGYLFLHNK